MDEHVKKQVWLIDPVHTKIRFETKYLLITSVSGWFRQFEGMVTSDSESFDNCQVRVTIYSHSICTGNQQRDDHLRSADFFDAARFPIISFTSTSVVVDESKVSIAGHLSMKGVTEAVGFEAAYVGTTSDPLGNLKAGFDANLSLNRKNFDISWNQVFDKTGVLLSDEVKVFCDVQLLKVF